MGVYPPPPQNNTNDDDVIALLSGQIIYKMFIGAFPRLLFSPSSLPLCLPCHEFSTGLLGGLYILQRSKAKHGCLVSLKVEEREVVQRSQEFPGSQGEYGGGEWSAESFS